MLDHYLSLCYKESVLKNSALDSVMDTFKKRIEANQSLKSSAQKKLSELTDTITKRCFVSKKYREFLQTALVGGKE